MHPELLKIIEIKIRNRGKLCMEQNGGHFEPLIKFKTFQTEQ